MTPSDVRRKIESLAKQRDMLMAMVSDLEQRIDPLTQTLKQKRAQLATVIMELNEALPS